MNIHTSHDESTNDDERGADDPILARWAAELADRLRAGESPDLERYTREHPERAEQLRRLLPTIAMMAKLGTAADQPCAPGFEPGVGQGTVGDFRLLREVGRGGMGVVYEALEVPLGRRVALKILPFAAALDPRLLKRFQLEAQAVASLNHRNIVPIYSVGRDRGIAYFAMQLIDGCTLADVNRELRQFDKPGVLEETIKVSDVTRSLLKRPPLTGSGEAGGSAMADCEADVAPPPPQPERASTPHSLPPTRGRAFYRMVAGLGRQAAEALAHVHELGIQHRDIKPANLLVDRSGHLWVTDFGLARLQGDGDQTRTGDMVGTLRYMSPEQALAQPGMIDHRTDIYSLGATLYELLTLRPPFGGNDRQNLLMRIVHEEPAPPRRMSPTIPIDLETIVSKAMAREPGRRYATAQELAEDLTRFLEGHPVLARRPSPVDGAAKWVRRRWSLVATAAALILLFVGISIAGLSWSNARLRKSNERLQGEVARADQLQKLAEEKQRVANRHLYAAQIRLAEQALGQGQIQRTQDILDEIQPDPDGYDPRHFAWHYLRRLATREIVPLRGHEVPVHYVTISPDGRSLASSDTMRRVLLWDVTTGKLRAELAGKTLVTGNPKFSPDGRLVIATESEVIGNEISRVGQVRALLIWDAVTGRLITRTAFKARAGHFLGAGFVSGGASLGIQWVEPDASISVSLGELTPALSEPEFRVEVKGLQGARFAPGGRVFCTLEHDRFQFRDVTTGTIRHVLAVRNGPGMFWDLSPDGRYFVLSGPGHGVTIWNVDTCVEISRDETRIVRGPASFSADGQTMVAEDVRGFGVAHLCDLSTQRWDTLRLDPSGRKQAFHFSLSAHGAQLGVTCMSEGGGGGPVTLWDVRTRQLIKSFRGRPGIYTAPVFTADDQSLFLACSPEIIQWSLVPPDNETPRSFSGHTDEVWAVVFSPDGRILASGSNDTEESKTIKLWDAATGRFLRGWKGHDATVSALAFSPDGRFLASVALCDDENAKIWDVATGHLRSTLVGHTKRVRTVAYSPDGTLLATAGTDHVVRLWDSGTGRSRGVLTGHTDTVQQVAFSPNGQQLASAGNDRTIRLWNVATRVQKHHLDGPEHFRALVFSPDGSLLATTDEVGRIALWDPASGTLLAKIHCDDGELRGLTFSPNGVLIAAAGASRSIHLWDVTARQELMTLVGHEQQINGLAFTPDGMILASCSHDGVIKLWNANSHTSTKHVNKVTGNGQKSPNH
ncbi:protein kinase [Singulisphaera sp. Ch08]|uniref:Protein kinase n=1 Tax=Singulisphaera sp. Ch08 TaxID=3120278 RepID=A0AAU7CD07_9BACT